MLSRSVEFFETFPGDTSLIHHPSSPINFLPNSKIRGNDNNNNYYNSNSYIKNFHNPQYNNSLIFNIHKKTLIHKLYQFQSQTYLKQTKENTKKT